MMTRYEVWLDKKSMSEIDPSIMILDVSYTAPRYAVTANDIPGGNGQRVTNRHAQTSSVTVTFEIHEQDISRRQDVMRRVQEWAAKGTKLTTNDRYGQRLCVLCESFPSITSALKWTQALKMTFTAYDPPFWEDENPRGVSFNGSNGETTLYVPGFGAKARVSCEVTNTSGETIDALTVKAGGTFMEFTELGLENSQTLHIGYDANMLLEIHAGGFSKMKCRTAESSDELMIRTGQASAISVTSEGTVKAVFRARGLYM